VTTVAITANDSGLAFDLDVWTPRAAGTYAVVVYLPGFSLAPTDTTGLLEAVAGHGVVVVGVGLRSGPFNQIASADEAEDIPAVIAFARAGLQAALPAGVDVDGAAPVIAAHSRGGKVTWRALVANPRLARGLALLDPVDAPPPPGASITDNPAVTGPVAFAGPALVLGTGRGPQGAMPCAPEDHNHDEFAAALPSPTHLLGANAGHNDILDSPPCFLGFCACVGGDAPEAFRAAAAGLVTAVVRATVGVDGAIDDAVATLPADAGIAPF
jgi:pimeloyl-ACP methyl ester carboxylesterase